MGPLAQGPMERNDGLFCIREGKPAGEREGKPAGHLGSTHIPLPFRLKVLEFAASPQAGPPHESMASAPAIFVAILAQV